MSKYIKLEDILYLAKKGVLISNSNYVKVCKIIESLPIIDIVECDECLYKNECLKVVKNIDGTLTWLNWCSFGERIEE